MSRKSSQKKVKRKKESISIWVIIPVVATIITGLIKVADFVYDKYRARHPLYIYDFDSEWMEMENLVDVLADDNNMIIYTPDPLNRILDSKEYFNGVSLNILFSNRSDVERCIKKCTIYLDEVIPNLSPNIIISTKYMSNPITFHFRNIGWGVASNGYISIDNIHGAPTDITLKDQTENCWHVETILQGESQTLSIDGMSLFNIPWDDISEEEICFSVDFTLHFPEIGYEQTSTFVVNATRNEIYGSEPGRGSPGGEQEPATILIVDIDEYSPNNTHYIYQNISAGETIKLPFFILPTKSCTMSIRVELELENGETLRATPLAHAVITVPYYTDLEEHIKEQTLYLGVLE